MTKHAEERLARIKPTSAILRKAEPVLRRDMLSLDKRREIDEEIGNWTCEMRSREKDMDEEKVTLLVDDFSSQPEIRKAKPNTKVCQRHKYTYLIETRIYSEAATFVFYRRDVAQTN